MKDKRTVIYDTPKSIGMFLDVAQYVIRDGLEAAESSLEELRAYYAERAIISIRDRKPDLLLHKVYRPEDKTEWADEVIAYTEEKVLRLKMYATDRDGIVLYEFAEAKVWKETL